MIFQIHTSTQQSSSDPLSSHSISHSLHLLSLDKSMEMMMMVTIPVRSSRAIQTECGKFYWGIQVRFGDYDL
jgi:hypothetical protein